MTTLPKVGVSLALLTLAGAALAAPPAPTYTTLDVPKAILTEANGINDQAQVVGSYYDAAGNQHGFLEANGAYYTGDIPGANATVATGISNDEIVGYTVVNSTDQFGGVQTTYHGFVVSKNGYTTFNVPGADPGTTRANGINNKDQIVGSYSSTVSSPYGPQSITHGFLLSHGVFTTLDEPNGSYTSANGINDKGQIVGTYLDQNDNEQGFLLTGGKYTSLYGPGDSYLAYANGINAAGQVVGYSQSSSTYEDIGFLFSRGVYTQIAFPGAGSSTFPNGINAKGQIVGSYSDAAGTTHGFLLTPAHT